MSRATQVHKSVLIRVSFYCYNTKRTNAKVFHVKKTEMHVWTEPSTDQSQLDKPCKAVMPNYNLGKVGYGRFYADAKRP